MFQIQLRPDLKTTLFRLFHIIHPLSVDKATSQIVTKQIESSNLYDRKPSAPQELERLRDSKQAITSDTACLSRKHSEQTAAVKFSPIRHVAYFTRLLHFFPRLAASMPILAKGKLALTLSVINL